MLLSWWFSRVSATSQTFLSSSTLSFLRVLDSVRTCSTQLHLANIYHRMSIVFSQRLHIVRSTRHYQVVGDLSHSSIMGWTCQSFGDLWSAALLLIVFFRNMRQSSDSPRSIFILIDFFLWYSLNSEIDFELLFIRDPFPDAGTTLKLLIALDLASGFFQNIFWRRTRISLGLEFTTLPMQSAGTEL